MMIDEVRTLDPVARLVDLRGEVLDNGRYAIRGMIGRGSMGYVYRAYDNRLQTEVVIKVPTASRLEEHEFRERFLQECRILVRLSHPNVVKVIDVGQYEFVPYVVMQYLPGGSLRDRLLDAETTRVGMPPESLAIWLMDIAKAIDSMHRQNFIHRDIKPANIMFDEHDHPYLGDFGLAKIVEADCGMTAAGAVVGSPHYTAPEIVLAREFDGRADQYSLAITVHEVLTGQVPLSGGSATATMVMQANTEPPPLCTINPAFSRQFSRVVLKALSKNPRDRYANCVEFATAVLNALGVDGGQSSSTRRVPRALRENPDRRDDSHDSQATSVPRMPGESTSDHDSDRMVRRRDDRTAGCDRMVHTAGAVTHGADGMIPCPACRRILELKPKHAGHRGNCKWCHERLVISSDLTWLRHLPQSKEVLPEEATEGALHRSWSQIMAVFDDEPVQVQMTKRTILALAAGGALLIVLLLVALVT